MTPHNAILLFSISIVAGAINSVAGGGSFLSFPALVFTGVPPSQAKADTTSAPWPGTLASVGPYRDDMLGDKERMLIPLIMTGQRSRLLDATILLKTPQAK